MWPTTASWIVEGGIGNRVKKLIFLDPESEWYLGLHASLSRATDQSDLKSNIEWNVRRLIDKGIDADSIRYFDGPILAMAIFEPESRNAWIRLEPWGPYMESKRAVIIVRRRKQRQAFNALLESFNEMWERSRQVAERQ